MSVKQSLLLSLSLMSLSACANRYELHYAAPCSQSVPQTLVDRVPGAPLPNVDGDESWFQFANNQTNQLSKANDRGDGILDAIKRCEAHDRSAVIAPKGKFIGVFIKKK